MLCSVHPNASLKRKSLANSVGMSLASILQAVMVLLGGSGGVGLAKMLKTEILQDIYLDLEAV